MRLFVDQLTNVDFSYLCPQRGLLGETWLANIELRGELNDQGMVCDFGIVKKICRQWLDEYLDHRLLVPDQYSKLQVIRSHTQHELSFTYSQGEINSQSPSEAITYIPTQAITPQSVASWCETQLIGKFGDTVKGLSMNFTTENIEGPFYHYSHGLKKHDGNCQRIAHGHRSKIIIWRNGKIDLELMRNWADLWCDAYIATAEDLTHSDELQHHFAYQSAQGHFSLSLPQQACYFIPSDSTVENLAQHIAHTLAQRTGDHIQVKAFEGLAKGAIADS